MAILAFNGFDHLPATTDLTLYPQWTASDSALGLAAGLLGGFCLQSSGFQNVIWTSPSATYATLIVGARIRVTDTIGAGTAGFLVFQDGTTTQCGFGINSSNRLIFYRGTTSTVIATGSTTTFVNNGWYWFECKVTFGASGTYEAKIGGVSEFSGSADTTSTANDYATRVNFTMGSNSFNVIKFLDDVYIADTTGSAPVNDFLGVIRVETTFVTTNNSVTWTPLSSTNASQVDEVAVDGDTTYNSTSGAGNIDTFNHGSLSSTPAAIYGVAVVSKFRKDDVGTRNARNKLISGSTTVSGTTTAVNTVYAYVKDYWLVDPDTSAAWASATAVNATKIGYENV